MWGALIIAMLLIAPHANYHDLLLLFVPCLALVRGVANLEETMKVRVAILCGVTWVTIAIIPLVKSLIAPSLVVVPLLLPLLLILQVFAKHSRQTIND